jgi:hypothetical protein
VAHGLSACSMFIACRPVLASLRVDLSRCQSFVAEGLADRPPERRGQSAQHELLTDRPRTRRGPSGLRGALLEVLLCFLDCPLEGRGPSAQCPWTVRPSLADRPPGLSQSC